MLLQEKFSFFCLNVLVACLRCIILLLKLIKKHHFSVGLETAFNSNREKRILCLQKKSEKILSYLFPLQFPLKY